MLEESKDEFIFIHFFVTCANVVIELWRKMPRNEVNSTLRIRILSNFTTYYPIHRFFNKNSKVAEGACIIMQFTRRANQLINVT